MKHLFKPLNIIIVILFLNFSCQKDDTINQIENVDIESINAFNLSKKEIPSHILYYVEEKTNHTFKVNIAKKHITLSNQNINVLARETSLGIVHIDKVVQVYNETNTKYTFKVHNPSDANSVINLVVVDMGDGNIIEYFIQYIFDTYVLIPLLDCGAVDMSRFTGNIIFYDNSGNTIGNLTMNNGNVSDSTGSSNPCADNNNTNNVDSDDNSSSGGGGATGNTDNENTNDDNGDDGIGSTGGAGELENPDTPCGLIISYGNCGCGNQWADGHSQTTNLCCSGSPTTLTNTCNGYSVTFNNNNGSSNRANGELLVDPCAGETGVLIDIEEFELMKEDIEDCLEDSYNIDWFNNLEFSQLSDVHAYLITENNCSTFSKNAIGALINILLTNTDLDFHEALLEAGIVIINSDEAVKVNPSEELECFDLTQGATITVYVQQPWENSDAVVGANEVGHAFIGIEQGGVVRQVGYYPDKEPGFLDVGKDFEAAIKTNYNYLYHVSITKDISSEQLTDIVNYTIDFPSTYNTNNYACADFAIDIGNLGGMNLPSTTVSGYGFSGRSPGKLGQEIRAMNSTDTTTITTTSGNSPTRQGDCAN